MPSPMRHFGYDQAMAPRTKRYLVAGGLAVAMVVGQVLERVFGVADAFMTIVGIAVALAGAWLVGIIMESRRR